MKQRSMFEVNKVYLFSVAKLALDQINNSSNILPNYELDLIVGDGKCSADSVMRSFIRSGPQANFNLFSGQSRHLLLDVFRLPRIPDLSQLTGKMNKVTIPD